MTNDCPGCGGLHEIAMEAIVDMAALAAMGVSGGEEWTPPPSIPMPDEPSSAVVLMGFLLRGERMSADFISRGSTRALEILARLRLEPVGEMFWHFPGEHEIPPGSRPRVREMIREAMRHGDSITLVTAWRFGVHPDAH